MLMSRCPHYQYHSIGFVEIQYLARNGFLWSNVYSPISDVTTVGAAAYAAFQINDSAITEKGSPVAVHTLDTHRKQNLTTCLKGESTFDGSNSAI